jgi:DNA-binding beta-propeller fold protein YncE/mono/diheme cytochrome c family protein
MVMRTILAFGLTGAIAVGCAGTKTIGKTATGAGIADCAASGASAARPLTAGAGSTVALAKVQGRTIAYIADEDARAILAVDVDAKRALGSTPTDGAPAQLLVLRDGRLVSVLRDTSQLQVLEAVAPDKPLVTRCAIKTDSEPVALAATKDERAIVVTSAWGKSLTVYDAARLTASRSTALPREPRAVVIGDDDATAFVSHAVGGQMSVVDLKTSETIALSLHGQDPNEAQNRKSRRRQIATLKQRPKPPKSLIEQLEAEEARTPGRMSCQGFALAKSISPAGRVLAPQVFVDPGDPEQLTDGYGDGSQPTEMAAIAVVDDGARTALDASLALSVDGGMLGPKEARDHREECLLPRAAAVDPRTQSLLVACYGIDNVVAYNVASATPAASEKRRWVVGAGPSGIAVDPEKPRAFVWSQFDRTLGVLDLGGPDLVDDKGLAPKQVARIAMPALAKPVAAEYALGRLLFHAVGDARISHDGRACASCHPDGRDDAITWATPEGPRRSILLAGRVAKTPPYSWNGNENTLHDHLANTFDRLDGTGLRSLELDALVTYISTMHAPGGGAAPENDAAVARGAAIFASKEAGCASCHVPGALTDGARHDVQSRTNSDRSASFNTPSLRFVGGTGPYFHDGRYKTLHDLLRDVDGKMGHTKHLSENDLAALESYLRTL